MEPPVSRLPSWLLLLAAAAAIAGCGKSEYKTAATQVAAKVNGDEISVHQVNHLLTRFDGAALADTPAAARREALEKLIEQQLAGQQAIDQKLDRTPGVMQALEAARRDVLARAYLEQVAGAQPAPTVDDARQFYHDHPELFAARRLYYLQEIALQGSTQLAGEITRWAAEGRSMPEIAGSLRARGVKVVANAGARSAEQIPFEALPRYHALRDGQTVVFDNPDGLLVVHLLASQPQPVAEEGALPRIQQFLANRRAADAVGREMRELRERARIERLGEFAAEAPMPKAAAPRPTPDDSLSLARGVVDLK